MKAHLVKGSAAAKAYMAKLRSKKKKVGSVKKKAVKKAAPKKKAVKKAVAKSLHKDTKSHNVNIRVVSGIGALPVGMTGKFWGIPFKVYNQFDIYGAVTAIVEDTNNGKLIVEVTSRTKAPAQIESFKNYIAINAGIDEFSNIKEIERSSKQFITNLYNEVKKYNEGKTGTGKAKTGINIHPKKTAVKKAVHHGKTTKTSLKENLKSEGLKLTHGYNLAARKIGSIKDEYQNIISYENEIAKIKNFIKTNPKLTQKIKNEYAKGINYYKRLITSSKYNISLHKK